MTINLVQITDCHLYADTSVSHYGVNSAQSLDSVLASVANESFDVLVVTGDVSGDYSMNSYQHFVSRVKHFVQDIPVFWLSGNHDEPEIMRDIFAVQPSWKTGQILIGDWLLLAVDTYAQGKTSGFVSEEELNRVRRSIESHQGPVLVFTHHPPFRANFWMDKHGFVNACDLTQTLQYYPSVKGLVCGHLHADICVELPEFPIYCSPSTCWQWGQTKEFSVDESGPGFRYIELGPQSIRTRVSRVNMERDPSE